MRDSKQYSGDGTVATMADKMFYYFAYGSNMDEDQMECRCPGARLLHKVTIPDYTFRIDSRGVASIIPKRGAKVTGLLWEINKYHILSLDRFEGIKGRYYRRVAVPLEHEGRTITAIAYLSNSNCDRQYTPKPGYMEKIIKAAKVHVFDDAYIRELEAFLQ